MNSHESGKLGTVLGRNTFSWVLNQGTPPDFHSAHPPKTPCVPSRVVKDYLGKKNPQAFFYAKPISPDNRRVILMEFSPLGIYIHVYMFMYVHTCICTYMKKWWCWRDILPYLQNNKDKNNSRLLIQKHASKETPKWNILKVVDKSWQTKILYPAKLYQVTKLNTLKYWYEIYLL